MYRFVVAAPLLVAFAISPAAASGGVSCEGKDARAEFDLHIPMSRDGSAVLAVNGEVKVADPRAPQTLREVKFEKSMLKRNGFAKKRIDISVDLGKALRGARLTIWAKEDEEDDYRGRYEITFARAGKSERIAGEAKCIVD